MNQKLGKKTQNYKQRQQQKKRENYPSVCNLLPPPFLKQNFIIYILENNAVVIIDFVLIIQLTSRNQVAFFDQLFIPLLCLYGKLNLPLLSHLERKLLTFKLFLRVCYYTFHPL